jgi:hypothetical protein
LKYSVVRSGRSSSALSTISRGDLSNVDFVHCLIKRGASAPFFLVYTISSKAAAGLYREAHLARSCRPVRKVIRHCLPSARDPLFRAFQHKPRDDRCSGLLINRCRLPIKLALAPSLLELRYLSCALARGVLGLNTSRLVRSIAFQNSIEQDISSCLQSRCLEGD